MKMKKIIKLTESDLVRIVKKVINEQSVAGAPGYGVTIPFMTRTKEEKPDTPKKENINPKNLKLGDGGKKNPGQIEDVKTLQRKLMDLQLLQIGEPTGYFGPLTQSALDKYNKQTEGEKKPVLKLSDREKKQYLNCVLNSPNAVVVKTKKNVNVIKIDDYYFYNNMRAKLPDGRMSTYYCYKNGVKLKLDNGETKYFETGVETKYEETSRIEGGLKGFLRKRFPNVAELVFTRPLTEKDFNESSKQVIYDAIQHAITVRNQDPKNGGVEYIDYGEDIDKKLNRDGGATSFEMITGTIGDERFRIATILGQFNYTLQPDGSYLIDDKYDFSKWKSFTVSQSELKGMSYPQKIWYIKDKTGLSWYGALRHYGWLEHPDNAPESTKTKLKFSIYPGQYAKKDQKTVTGNDIQT